METDPAPNAVVRLTLNHFKMVFSLLAIGLGLSCVIFILEISTFKKKGKRNITSF